MSTPILWIVLPFVVGFILFLLRRWYRTTVLIGSLTSIALAISAWVIPVNEIIRLGPLVFKVNDSLNILGRRLVLGSNDRELLILIFGLTAFWFSAAYEARAGRLFVPIGLALVALWIAALAVEPFLYAALILELAVLLSIPMLSSPGSRLSRGVIRYLILQSFGMPFILLTGWLLAGVESSPGDTALVVQANTLLGLGFLFMLAVFPFHTWLPMLGEETHPYSAGFIFFFLPLLVSLLGLNFLDQYAWLRQSPNTYAMLRLAGVLMMVIGGIWAALQRHLGRIFGFAVLTSTGVLLLSIGSSLELFFAMQIPRALSFSLWALGLSTIRNKMISVRLSEPEANPLTPDTVVEMPAGDALRFRNVYGLGRQMPITTLAIGLAILSLAGYPILASFPVYQTLWYRLSLQSPIYALLSLVGNLCLGIGGLRCISVLVMGDEEKPWVIGEPWVTSGFLGVGILILLLTGLFPQVILPFTTAISQTFSQITPQIIVP